jgi:hypothetical protein
MADIQTIVPVGRTIDIVHPGTGEPIGLRWSLLSLMHESMKPIQRKIIDERMKLEQRGKSLKADDLEQNTNALCFRGSTGWEWYNPTGAPGDKDYDPNEMGSFGGEQLEFNQKNVGRVLTEISWIRGQVSDAIADEQSFFKPSKSI